MAMPRVRGVQLRRVSLLPYRGLRLVLAMLFVHHTQRRRRPVLRQLCAVGVHALYCLQLCRWRALLAVRRAGVPSMSPPHMSCSQSARYLRLGFVIRIVIDHLLCAIAQTAQGGPSVQVYGRLCNPRIHTTAKPHESARPSMACDGAMDPFGSRPWHLLAPMYHAPSSTSGPVALGEASVPPQRG
jgi:hypothetical protein